MYVVVEFNQASHRPRIADDEVHDDAARAEWVAELYRSNTASVGRRERFQVFELVEVED